MLGPGKGLDWLALNKENGWCRGSETMPYSSDPRSRLCSYAILGNTGANLNLPKIRPNTQNFTSMCLGADTVSYSVPEASSSLSRRKEGMIIVLKVCRAVLDHFVWLSSMAEVGNL